MDRSFGHAGNVRRLLSGNCLNKQRDRAFMVRNSYDFGDSQRSAGAEADLYGMAACGLSGRLL